MLDADRQCRRSVLVAPRRRRAGEAVAGEAAGIGTGLARAADVVPEVRCSVGVQRLLDPLAAGVQLRDDLSRDADFGEIIASAIADRLRFVDIAAVAEVARRSGTRFGKIVHRRSPRVGRLFDAGLVEAVGVPDTRQPPLARLVEILDAREPSFQRPQRREAGDQDER